MRYLSRAFVVLMIVIADSKIAKPDLSYHQQLSIFDPHFKWRREENEIEKMRKLKSGRKRERTERSSKSTKLLETRSKFGSWVN